MPYLFMRRLNQKFNFFSCFLFVFPLFISAQSAEQLYKAANESFAKGDYYAAAKYFQQALDKDDSQAEIWFGFAESSRLFNDYKNAAIGYAQTLKRDNYNSFPLSHFWLGCMLMNQGDYNNAKQHLIDFQNKYRKKDYYAQKAQQLIESCAWALANNGEKPIEITQLPDSVNSTYSELNPFLSLGGDLYYSSTKPLNGKSFRTQIWIAKTGERFLPGVEPVAEQHIANGFFSNNENFGIEFFFTQCNTESGVTRCKIFVSKLEHNQWQTAKELPVNINLSGYTATHPNVLNDANGNQWLFFSSNRPGTKGKMDIWISKRLSSTEWDFPQNAGSSINSIDDEVTPFADAASNQLYFSSLWHYGYGGFDVFSAEIVSLSKAQFGKPQNLGLPLNSCANDLYYAVYDSVAFFSSNRLGSKSIEAETCCNDIYKVIIHNSSDSIKHVLLTERLSEKKEEFIAHQANENHDFQNEILIKKDTLFKSSLSNSQFVNQSNQLPSYISLMLYFHNDEPNPKSTSDTTTLSYLEAYESYINLKNEYEYHFSNGLKAGEKKLAAQRVASWFADTVEVNFLKLISLLSQVENALKNGKTIRLKISGYCSPLNFNEYNQHLGNRRATSVLNFLLQYKNSVFQKFVADGKLKVERISNGEETAAKSVSDSLCDLRNSVYNPDAARERRVELYFMME